jgi:hypothetical protein
MIYCCNDCEAFGLESVLNEKCCDTHHHHHLEETENGSVNFHHTDHDSFCDMDRLAVNWLLANTDQPTIEPIIIDLNQLFAHKQLFPIPLDNMEQNVLCEQEQVSIPPSEYLSLLTILII